MIIIRARPSPFEVMFMIAAMLGGLVILVLRQRLGTASTTQLPVLITIIFGLGLVVGSSVVLIGLALRTLLGSLLERAGLTTLALLMVVYSAVTLDFNGIHATVTVTFFTSFAVACGWRFLQIGREINDVQDNLVGDAVRSLNDDTEE